MAASMVSCRRSAPGRCATTRPLVPVLLNPGAGRRGRSQLCLGLLPASGPCRWVESFGTLAPVRLAPHLDGQLRLLPAAGRVQRPPALFPQVRQVLRHELLLFDVALLDRHLLGLTRCFDLLTYRDDDALVLPFVLRGKALRGLVGVAEPLRRGPWSGFTVQMSTWTCGCSVSSCITATATWSSTLSFFMSPRQTVSTCSGLTDLPASHEITKWAMRFFSLRPRALMPAAAFSISASRTMSRMTAPVSSGSSVGLLNVPVQVTRSLVCGCAPES